MLGKIIGTVNVVFQVSTSGTEKEIPVLSAERVDSSKITSGSGNE